MSGINMHPESGIDEKQAALSPAEKARQEQLEATAGVINQKSPFDRPAHWVDIDPKAEAAVRRKIDIRLVPLCTLLYL